MLLSSNDFQTVVLLLGENVCWCIDASVFVICVCMDIFLVIIFIGVSLRVSTYVWLHFVLILPLRPRFSFVLDACVCNAYRRDSSKKIIHVCEYAWSIL